MLSIFQGNRPDLTPAQLAGVLVVGIPIVANLLAAFGVYTATPEQTEALQDTVTWAGGFAGLLVLGDAGIRVGRNVADARRDAAALTQPVTAPLEPMTGDAGSGAAVSYTVTGVPPTPGLPDDDEEFAGQEPPGPVELTDDEREPPIQPSQDAL